MIDRPTIDPDNTVLSALDYATRYAWPVFPLYGVDAAGRCACGDRACESQGKHPRTQNGFKNATCNVETIARWWKKTPDANIGLRTGAVSRFVVLDVDGDEGRQSLAALALKHGELPTTPCVRTGSGGLHYFFQHPGAYVKVKNSCKTIGDGLDVRGDGGYIVAVPSLHKSGARYVWVIDPDEAAIAPTPAWLREMVIEKPRPTRPATVVPLRAPHNAAAWAAGAIDKEWARVSSAPEGQRNNTLNSAAFKLGNIVGGGYLSRETVEGALMAAGVASGLSEAECTRTIQSGLPAGEKKPRGPSERPAPAERVFEVTAELPPMIDAVMPAIAGGGLPGIYQRGGPGELVRLCRDAPAPRGIKRPSGAPTIQPVPHVQLQAHLERMGQWVRVKREAGKAAYHVAAAPPPRLVEWVRTCGEWPGIPPLEGIIEAPTMRADGSILCEPGYDQETGLLLEPSAEFPPVPARPTLEDAHEAVNALLEPLADFKFVSDSDKAAAVALALTLTARHAINGCVPMFAIRSTTPGEGKGLLTDVACIIGNGRPASRLVTSGDDAEMRKLITAVAIVGEASALIDNVVGNFGSSAIASAITAPSWSDRVLGESRTVEAPLTCTWILNGNNVRFAGDLARRVVVIDLDSGLEHPEDRPASAFKHPGVDGLLEYVTRERPRLLVAALTILRAYHVAGRPAHGLAPKGSFESWDALIRGACIWAGLADPDAGKERVREDDDADTASLGAALVEIEKHFAALPFTTAELARLAHDGDAKSELCDTLVEWAADRKGAVTARSVAYKIRGCLGRIVGGLKFERAGRGHEARLWVVRRVRDASNACDVPSPYAREH